MCISKDILTAYLNLDKGNRTVTPRNLSINISTVVEHLPHQPKVKGSSPAAAAGTRRKNGNGVTLHLQ
jgi:hypothetical protein